MTAHKQEHKIKLVYTHKMYELEDFKFLGFGVGFFFFLNQNLHKKILLIVAF